MDETTVTEDLATRLLAAITETEQVARAAIGHYRDGDSDTWHFDLANHGDSVTDEHGGYIACGPWDGPVDDGVGIHIARQDPKATLIHCIAHRKIVDELLKWEHDYNDDNPFQSCAQAVVFWDLEGQTPGDGCADEDRKGGPCDCATGVRRDRLLRALAEGYDLTEEAT